MDSTDNKQRRGELAETYLENCRDVRSSICDIEHCLINSDAKRILRMFQIFEAIAVKYGLIHNEVFTEAFSNYNFDEMTRLVGTITVANEILSDYVDQITTLSGYETESSSDDSDGSSS